MQFVIKIFGVSFDAHEGHAVAQGDDDGLELGVAGNEVVERHDAAALGVVVVGIVNDFAAPECVVGDDVATGTHTGQEGFDVGGVVAFVGIDKCHVPPLPYGRQDGEGIADVDVDVG